jgi:hypothetical protein
MESTDKATLRRMAGNLWPKYLDHSDYNTVVCHSELVTKADSLREMEAACPGHLTQEEILFTHIF